jgi:CheY-specific phosphatase CheX
MHDQFFDQLLEPAVSAVLETMFFSAPIGPGLPDVGIPCVEARVYFSGELSGIFRMRVSEASARSLAASFLGEFEENLSVSQIAEVVCELTNMLCGWIVSKAKSQGCFDLRPPELVTSQCEQLPGMPVCEKSFAVENGVLAVSLYPMGSYE